MSLVGSELTAIGSVPTAAGEDSPGGGGAVPTLAAVYAAGAGAPITDDLMGMLSGTTARFQANSDNNPLPLVGIYETAASKPLMSSGYPSFGQSLATDLGVLIGGRIFNWFEMFDPNWDGTLAALSAYSWHADTCSFQQQPATAWRRSNVFAQRDYGVSKNWQPQATPPGPLGAGPATTLHQVWLYNTSDPGLRVVDQLDGFGQTQKELTPIQNGVIYETAIHYTNRLIAPAANDGVGLAVYNGDRSHGGDVPQASFDFRTVGATAAGDWYAAIALRDTGGDGLLHDVATFNRTGATFNVPISIDPTSTVPQTFVTGVVDLRTPGAYVFNTPLAAGKKLAWLNARLLMLTRDATLTTGMTWTFGQNGVACSGAISPTAATFNADTAPTSLSAVPSFAHLIDMTTFPLQILITAGVAGAGLTTCNGQWIIQAIYV